jgi:hypothetical protein
MQVLEALHEVLLPHQLKLPQEHPTTSMVLLPLPLESLQDMVPKEALLGNPNWHKVPN